MGRLIGCFFNESCREIRSIAEGKGEEEGIVCKSLNQKTIVPKFPND